MMEERHDLLDFMAEGPLPLRILTLESSCRACGSGFPMGSFMP